MSMKINLRELKFKLCFIFYDLLIHVICSRVTAISGLSFCKAAKKIVGNPKVDPNVTSKRFFALTAHICGMASLNFEISLNVEALSFNSGADNELPFLSGLY